MGSMNFEERVTSFAGKSEAIDRQTRRPWHYGCRHAGTCLILLRSGWPGRVQPSRAEEEKPNVPIEQTLSLVLCLSSL